MKVDVEDLELRDFKKLTGPIEHWVTTYNSNYWGLEEKHKDKWENLEPGQVLIFHGSNPEYISQTSQIRQQRSGIIGLGLVGAKSTKDEAVWLAELEGDGDWPLLIRFSEIYWFGNTEDIRDVPVAKKDEE